MSFTDFVHAAVLGLVQGATEFLPISSTGHLILTTDALGLDPSSPRMLVFNIVIQLASIFAVVWFFRERIVDVVRRLPTDPAARRFALAVTVACIPAAVLGLILDDWIEANLFSPVTVAMALVVGGAAILIVEHFAGQRTPRVIASESIGPADAFKVGLAQCLALFPGVSRSASTILGGMSFGFSRVAATEFSFFLAIPIMIGASSLKLFKRPDMLTGDDATFLAVGCVFAFLSSVVAIRFLLRFVATNTFRVFAWYRIGFGLAVFAYYQFS